MFDCPNCGESVQNDASFCAHCGSDAETGWRPDAEYQSLDLPDFEDNDYDPAPTYSEDVTQRLKNIVGPGAVVLCFVLFLSVGYKRYNLWIIPPSLLLMTMALAFLHGSRGKGREPRSRGHDR